MKPEFHENYRSEHADPLDAPAQDFDWDALAERMGEAGCEMHVHDWEAMAHALRVVLSWIIDCDLRNKGAYRVIAQRVISLCWALSPGMFEDSPSLAALARRLKVHRTRMSSFAVKASRKFKIRNRPQSGHGWRFGKKGGWK